MRGEGIDSHGIDVLSRPEDYSIEKFFGDVFNVADLLLAPGYNSSDKKRVAELEELCGTQVMNAANIVKWQVVCAQGVYERDDGLTSTDKERLRNQKYQDFAEDYLARLTEEAGVGLEVNGVKKEGVFFDGSH